MTWWPGIQSQVISAPVASTSAQSRGLCVVWVELVHCKYFLISLFCILYFCKCTSWIQRLYFFANVFLCHMAVAGKRKCSQLRFMYCVWVGLVHASIPLWLHFVSFATVFLDSINCIFVFCKMYFLVIWLLLASTSGLCAVWVELVHASAPTSWSSFLSQLQRFEGGGQ